MTGWRSSASRLTRREAIGLLGSGAGLALAAACRVDGAQSRPVPDGAVIRTILADVPPDALAAGATMFHEHLQFAFRLFTSPPPGPQARPGGPPPTDAENAAAIELVVEELRKAASDGVGCIVDAAVGRRSGREFDNLRQMANRSGMHVVVAGAYFKAPYPPDIIEMTIEQIADHLEDDAKAQRWGAFGEVGTSMEMHPDERKYLRAVAQAHLRTRVPIFTHTEHDGCASCALEQLDLFESEGVDPSHLCIGHLTDIKPGAEPLGRTAKAIAQRGAFLGFDTVGHEMSASSIPAAHKVKYVMEILEAGYEDNLLLAADFSQSRQLKANWGHGFSTVLQQFVPKLRYAGVDEATLQKVLVDNPRRFSCLRAAVVLTRDPRERQQGSLAGLCSVSAR